VESADQIRTGLNRRYLQNQIGRICEILEMAVERVMIGIENLEPVLQPRIELFQNWKRAMREFG